MKFDMRFFIILLLTFLAAPHRGPAMDLGEYQVILDKQLLGATRQVTVPAVTPPPTVAAPSWSREYQMTMMTRDQPSGTIRIGLQNIQNQSSVLLIEGKDRHEDFKLVSANYSSGTATISYRGASHQFRLQDGPATRSAPTTEMRDPSRINIPDAARKSGTIARPGRRSRPSTPDQESPTLQIRRFASQEELQEHLKQQQMDAIRTGKPPLPIPLTPEMDQQLVEEGVLPPLQEEQ